jgi:hypothetical protein
MYRDTWHLNDSSSNIFFSGEDNRIVLNVSLRFLFRPAGCTLFPKAHYPLLAVLVIAIMSHLKFGACVYVSGKVFEWFLVALLQKKSSNG